MKKGLMISSAIVVACIMAIAHPQGSTANIVLTDNGSGGYQDATAASTIPYLTLGGIGTESPCFSGASPAVCGASVSGAVAIPQNSGSPTDLVVETTAVTANSQILLTPNPAAMISGVTCGTNTGTNGVVNSITGISPGSSFTIRHYGAVGADLACLNFLIVN